MNRIVFYFASSVIIAYLFFSYKEPPVPLFSQRVENVSSEVPVFIKNNLPKISQAPSVHSASITALNDHQRIAVWFAGSGEGKADVKIYGSLYDSFANTWTTPKPYLTREQLKKDSHQFIKKLGNPVIYQSSNGDIHLFVVGVTFGGWATSKIYHYISKDHAQQFSYAGLLQLGALMNLSHLVRSSPVGLEDGGFYLPIYHELAKKYPLIVRFNQEGKMLKVQKLNGLSGQLQPSLVALNTKECLAAFRNYHVGPMKMQQCDLGGLIWDTPIASNIINEGNSIVLFRLKERILLIHNTRQKTPLESRGTLVLSYWNYKEWKQVAILDIAQGKREGIKSVEVSYPNVYVGEDFVDLVYTNNRLEISHIRLNQKWIEDQIREGE